MPTTAPYTRYPALKETLPPLVTKQRTLAAKIAKVAQTIKDEEAIRKDIDARLVLAGLQKSDVVTCKGYDVRHNERDGQERISPKILTAYLTAMEWAPEDVAAILMAVTEVGQPAKFATVTPTKGAKVRT
jgi:hypothetical protein